MSRNGSNVRIGQTWLERKSTHAYSSQSCGAFATILVLAAQPADAATVSRTYEYFNLNGRTAADLDRELDRRGPYSKKPGNIFPA